MSTLSLRLPDSIHKKVRELAEQEGVSMNQFIATALAEKLSALMTAEYLESRASKGTRRNYDAVLRKVKDRPPEPGDEL